jgi:hypothetical protein
VEEESSTDHQTLSLALNEAESVRDVKVVDSSQRQDWGVSPQVTTV